MDKNKQLLDEYAKYMLPVLKFRDIVITKGCGTYVFDANNEKYLDLNSGQFCAVFGHSNPKLAEAITKSALEIQDTDTGTLSFPVLRAAKKLNEICADMNPRSVILSTGAEANECALRYAKHIKGKNGVISFDRAYHGQSHGTAAYSMSRAKIRPRVKYSFETPFPVNCHGEKEYEVYVNEFEKIISKNQSNIAAAIFEPVVSGGGLLFADKYYFKKIRNICDRYGIFLIFDECQTGFARTGTWFYYQQMGVVPDFLVSAKAIGLGYPVSCVMANGHTIGDELFVMEHYSSHQNEPFAAQIVNFGIDYIKNGNILKRNSKNGTYLLQNLKNLAKKHPIIANPRGKGLMCGFDLVHEYQNIQSKEFGALFCKNALKYKVIMQHCNNGRTIRILPSYIVKKEDIDFFIRQIDAMLTECF